MRRPRREGGQIREFALQPEARRPPAGGLDQRAGQVRVRDARGDVVDGAQHQRPEQRGDELHVVQLRARVADAQLQVAEILRRPDVEVRHIAIRDDARRHHPVEDQPVLVGGAGRRARSGGGPAAPDQGAGGGVARVRTVRVERRTGRQRQQHRQIRGQAAGDGDGLVRVVGIGHRDGEMRAADQLLPGQHGEVGGHPAVAAGVRDADGRRPRQRHRTGGHDAQAQLTGHGRRGGALLPQLGAQFAQVGVHAGLTFDDAGLQFLDERRARQSAQQFRSPRDEASGGEVHDVELLRHPDFRDPGIVHDPKLLGNDKRPARWRESHPTDLDVRG